MKSGDKLIGMPVKKEPFSQGGFMGWKYPPSRLWKRVLSERESGRTWPEIEEISPGFVEWAHVDDEFLNAYPDRRLPSAALSNWYYWHLQELRLEREWKDILSREMGEAAATLANDGFSDQLVAFVKHMHDKGVWDKSGEITRKMLLAQHRRKLMEKKLAIEQQKLELQKQKLEEAEKKLEEKMRKNPPPTENVKPNTRVAAISATEKASVSTPPREKSKPGPVLVPVPMAPAPMPTSTPTPVSTKEANKEAVQSVPQTGSSPAAPAPPAAYSIPADAKRCSGRRFKLGPRHRPGIRKRMVKPSES